MLIVSFELKIELGAIKVKVDCEKLNKWKIMILISDDSNLGSITHCSFFKLSNFRLLLLNYLFNSFELMVVTKSYFFGEFVSVNNFLPTTFSSSRDEFFNSDFTFYFLFN